MYIGPAIRGAYENLEEEEIETPLNGSEPDFLFSKPRVRPRRRPDSPPPVVAVFASPVAKLSGSFVTILDICYVFCVKPLNFAGKLSK